MAAKLAARAELELAKPDADIKLLMNILEMCTGFLAKREKYKPAEEEDDSAGVLLLKQMLDDPAQVVDRLHANPKFRNALKLKGWLPPPDKKTGRPSRAEQAHREEYETRVREEGHDREDGELAAALGRKDQ